MAESAPPAIVTIGYDPVRVVGRLELAEGGYTTAWERLGARALDIEGARVLDERAMELPWPDVLDIMREFGTRQAQQSMGFRFRPMGEATSLLQRFAEELRQVRAARDSLTLVVSPDDARDRLKELGFRRRELKPFQLRDLVHLASLPNGANFSVPGAGKTTVTFALHLLTRPVGGHLFVVCPKAAFPAWREIVDECMAPDAPDGGSEPFTVLDGRPDEVDRALRSGSTRFVMSYDLMVRQQSTIAAYLARQAVHLVLDEAHRMKAGAAAKRGAFLLGIASLPVRRDILTGTPMPQSASDLASQLGFLWPGQGLDIRIDRGIAPRDVLGNLYVRTTKTELGLPPVDRTFYTVPMAEGHLALYAVVRDEALRQLAPALRRGASNVDFVSARRSVMRLLQLSANPILALQSMTDGTIRPDSGIVDQVLAEGPSLKMRAVADHARALAAAGEKTVIWTIFTGNIGELERMLADLNPVSLYGAVPSGEPSDPETREGRLKRFHVDDGCKVMIANPAAAGEGISLHHACHNAIYLDRSYVSTHYLQSIDRIHRLGLDPGVETHIHVYRTAAPAGVGSIDSSVSRRLATKLRNLQQLLDDPDLHNVALDEENADDPIDYDVDLQDLVDLVAELEGRTGGHEEAEA